MRVSILPNDAGYEKYLELLNDRKTCRVFLDGKEKHCVTADEELRYVVCDVPSGDARWGAVANGVIPRETLKGRVEIRIEDELAGAQPPLVEVLFTPDPPGTIYAQYIDAKGNRVCTSQRSSFELSADASLTYKALEFKYAARRQGRVLIVAMFPQWAARVLSWFGIKGEK